MARINLERMTIADLRALERDVDAEMSRRKKDEVRAAADRMKKIAAEYGLSLEDVVRGGKKSATKSKGPPKFRNPNNRQETWSGRGKRPNWLNQLLAQGKRLEDLAIR